MNENENKGARLLDMYDRLSRGELLSKKELADTYGVTTKTVQCDIDELRAHLAETSLRGGHGEIRYDPARKGYRLVRSTYEHLNHKEILALAKILLESRALEPGEMHGILAKLTAESPPEERGVIESIIKSEAFYYVPLKHGKKLLDRLWDLSLAIRSQEILSIHYIRMDGVHRQHLVKPVAILFSEYYFYLVSFKEEETEFPTIFRVDRIEDMKKTGKTFPIPYAGRFRDGEFRKRVQFMYPGPLRRVTFTYSGPSVEAVLDRLPTAKIVEEKNGVYTIIAEAFGTDIGMWLGSQGERVKVISVCNLQ